MILSTYICNLLPKGGVRPYLLSAVGHILSI